MKRWSWATLMALVCLMACGEGGSLPTTNPDGSVGLPDIPTSPDPGASPSLWPLTAGSKWTYRITDPVRGVFEKQVEVLGPQTVPETRMTATAVRSVQPHLEELSWQIDLDGVVVRLREEDRKAGVLARVTTWSPATVKSLARAQAVGWTFESRIHEVTREGDGTVEEKDKTYVWRVAAENETVTTPAGTFSNALRLIRERSDKEGSERTYWLVPGVGKVKEDGERLEELVSLEVKHP
jgi:hypothetical protein